MHSLPQSTAPTFDLPGVRFTTLSAPSLGARENAVWKVVVQPGVEGTPHRLTREETFVVLEGRAVAAIDGERHELEVGNAFVVPAGRVFSLSNPGPGPFHALAVYPVGGKVLIGDQPAFTPAWAE